MVGKAERARITSTNNVYNLQKYRALKKIEECRGEFVDEFPWVDLVEDQEDHNQLRHKCLKGWFDAPEFKPALADYLGHHERMVTATNRIKARRDFIDGHSTDS